MSNLGDQSLLDQGGLRVERDDAVVTITLNNPEKRNAQNPATWLGLASIAGQLDGGVRVVVIRGEGESFSAGLDRRMFTEGLPGFPSLASMSSNTDEEFDALIAEFQRGFTVWHELDAVVIAAVQGHAIGAGFQLALGADIIIAADDAKFSMKETQLGLVPDLAGTLPLIDAVGYSRALDICLTGRWVHADEAVASGIAAASVPVAELDNAVKAKVDSILAALPGATVATKHLLRGARGQDRAGQIARERKAQRARILDLAAMFAPKS